MFIIKRKTNRVRIISVNRINNKILIFNYYVNRIEKVIYTEFEYSKSKLFNFIFYGLVVNSINYLSNLLYRGLLKVI